MSALEKFPRSYAVSGGSTQAREEAVNFYLRRVLKNSQAVG